MKPADKGLHQRIVNAWCMYDWANSAFATTVMAAFLPPYFSNVAAVHLPKYQASSIWGYAVALAMLFTALLGPILGAIADHTGTKKRFILAFLSVAVVFTAMLFFIREGDWLAAVIFYVLASIGNAGANIFYDSLLPHVARPQEIDQVSVKGFALGYLGGGLLLIVNLLWYMKPAWFGFPNANVAVRVSFLSVAVWWVVFSVPLFRRVPEPPPSLDKDSIHPVRAGFKRLRRTFRGIRHYKELFKFLIAFWLYADGIGTIIKMATVYGAEIGIGTSEMVTALVLTQSIGIPMTLFFGKLAKRIGTKHAIYLTLGVYTFISIGGYFMSAPWHFWILATLVGTVQGGSQALSRSLFGAMAPKTRSAEFFSFYDISSKFAGIAGPLLFGLVATFAGSSRLAIVSLTVFFVVGILLLTQVDEEEGKALARVENEKASPAVGA